MNSNLPDILSTSPHYLGGKLMWQQMRIQILILGFKGLKGPCHEDIAVLLSCA